MSIFEGLQHIVRVDEPLAPHNTLQMGGPAKYFAEPTTIEELRGIVLECDRQQIGIRLLGSGTNVLISDEGYDGMVIHLSSAEFSKVVVLQNGLCCSGGCKLAHFVSTAVREGFSGPENLVGIPGTVGGALHGNASANGGDMGQWTLSAEVLTRSGEIIKRSASEMNFGYRQSSLSELVILTATFSFESADPVELTKRMQKLWISKKSSSPDIASHCAFLFKDPGGVTAASLIEDAGLKQAQNGLLRLDQKNPNYLIASDGASSHDAVSMINEIKESVMKKLGVELEIGIEIW